MEHKTLENISEVASVLPDLAAFAPKSRKERLERWAAVLDEHKGQYLRPLVQIEFMRYEDRMVAREDNSPLSMAYGDPLLQAAGLEGDRYGQAMKFFELTDGEAHYLLCDCHHHGTMTADNMAARVRYVANGHFCGIRF